MMSSQFSSADIPDGESEAIGFQRTWNEGQALAFMTTPNQNPTSETRQMKRRLDEKLAEVQQLKEQLSKTEEELQEAEGEIAEQQLEVEQIATIQTELLPQHPPEIPHFRLAASYVAPGKAGGDYYDFLPMRRKGETDSLTMIVADASGHGPAAAVIMAMMHSLLHAFADNHTDPDQIASHMNRELGSKELSTALVTALVLGLDPIKRRLRYACAGHHPPLIRRGDGSVEELPCLAAGLPLSVDVDSDYGMDEVVLAPGELLLVFTDGAIEVANLAGQEFGLDGLMSAVGDGPCEANALIRHVNRRIAEHRGREEQTDDKTLLAIEAT